MKDLPYHKCLSTLSNELRLGIIEELESSPKPVSEIAQCLGEEQSKVSHALQQLKGCGFVDSERKGKEKVYRIKSRIFRKMKKQKNLFELLEDHYKHSCRGHCYKNQKKG